MKSSKIQNIAFKILIVVTIIDAGFALYNIFSNNFKDAILPIGLVPFGMASIIDYYKKNYSKK